jgi:hypothetical protein
MNLRGFHNDQGIYPQGLTGKLVLILEFQHIPVIGQFKLNGLKKSGMPLNFFMGTIEWW